MISLTFFSWLLAFMAQLNPLTGPQLEDGVAKHIRNVWPASYASQSCKLLHLLIIFMHILRMFKDNLIFSR